MKRKLLALRRTLTNRQIHILILIIRNDGFAIDGPTLNDPDICTSAELLDLIDRGFATLDPTRATVYAAI